MSSQNISYLCPSTIALSAAVQVGVQQALADQGYLPACDIPPSAYRASTQLAAGHICHTHIQPVGWSLIPLSLKDWGVAVAIASLRPRHVSLAPGRSDLRTKVARRQSEKVRALITLVSVHIHIIACFDHGLTRRLLSPRRKPKPP